MAGAIIVSLHHASFTDAIYDLKRRGYPFVLVDERSQHIDVPSVVADNYGGGYAVGRELLAAGHRRIGFIGRLAAHTVADRMNGLRDAMNDAGAPFDRSLVVDLDMTLEGDWPSAIGDATRALLNRQDRATAIFYSDDQTAMHAYPAIREMGLRVPDDVSVVGFDDNPLCQYIDPPLTTVRQPSGQMGRIAMEMLLKRIAHPRDPIESKIMPVEIVPRASVSRAAATSTDNAGPACVGHE